MPIIRSSPVAGDRRFLARRGSALALLVLTAWFQSPAWAQVPTPPPPGDTGQTPAPAQPANPVGVRPLDLVAQEPGAQATQVGAPLSEESQVAPILPQIPVKPPIPPGDPRSSTAFIESLRGNDASFEVLVNQARILTLKEDIIVGPVRPLIAVGDPTIVDFTVVNPRQLRIVGRGLGVTDLAITTGRGETYVYEVRVLADLTMIQGKLRATFPDASIKLSQIRAHFVVEGEARDPFQISRIMETIRAYLDSVFIEQGRTVTVSQTGQLLGALSGQQGPGGGAPGQQPGVMIPLQPGAAPGAGIGLQPGVSTGGGSPFAPYATGIEAGGPTQITNRGVPPQIINLMRVVGSQQVMLKVRIAELNRTALRKIGANFLGLDKQNNAILGSQIDGSTAATGTIGQPGNLILGNQLFGSAILAQNGLNTTVFGIFQNNNFEFTLGALRQNGLLKILAEPNLTALNGQTASFLAGGEFPVPVPQVSAGGVAPTITVRFREFGVRLGFVPYILDGGVIRLTVAPEVSNIDFTIATTLVAGGTPVPGLNTRKAQTTVELRDGQTLAMAGLMQLTLNGNTARVPGLGDLPIVGPFFSNTSSERIEKELVVLVTPYLIEPMSQGQVSPTPGDEVKEPNDLEFFFLNRIEGRTGKDFRGTTKWDDPWGIRHHLNLEKKYVTGPVGFSE